MTIGHAMALAGQGFWVFPVEPGGKRPMYKGWQENASRDPNVIASQFAGPCNIGIYTGKFGAEEGALLVVDVDVKKGKDGNESILALEMQGVDFPPTLTATTAGGGQHLFYSVPRAVKQGANVIGAGLDIRSRGGYVLGAGSTIGGGVYRWSVLAPIAPAPTWLVERCGTPRDNQRVERAATARVPLDGKRAVDRATAYLRDDNTLAVEGAGGDDKTYRVACRVKDYGISEEKCIDLLLEHWNERCAPPWDPDELVAKVRNAYSYGAEAPGVADPAAEFEPVADDNQGGSDSDGTGAKAPLGNPFIELNRKYAFVLAGGGSHILWEKRDPYGREIVDHLDESAFHKDHAALMTQVGNKWVPLTQEWMRWIGRRSYAGIVFMPDQPRDVIAP